MSITPPPNVSLFLFLCSCVVPIGAWDTVMLAMVLVGSSCSCFSMLVIVLDCSSLAVAIGVDEKTLQKWIFIIIYAISDLEDDWVGSLFTKILLMAPTIVFLQIKWENRFHGYHGRLCLVIADGTDFWICEPKPFAKDFYSHKFVKAGLHYEVGVCIQTGLIVWINGPFVVGKYNDITNFQSKMIYELLDWEMVEADQGYVGQPNKIHVKYELGVSENQFEAKARARARGR